MQEISEAEAWQTAGAEEPPVLAKYEREEARAAVTLKRWPHWYLLAMHRERDDRLVLWRIDGEAMAWAAYRDHAQRLLQTGVLFDEPAIRR